jgi:hypothetical protein
MCSNTQVIVNKESNRTEFQTSVKPGHCSSLVRRATYHLQLALNSSANGHTFKPHLSRFVIKHFGQELTVIRGTFTEVHSFFPFFGGGGGLTITEQQDKNMWRFIIFTLYFIIL